MLLNVSLSTRTGVQIMFFASSKLDSQATVHDKATFLNVLPKILSFVNCISVFNKYLNVKIFQALIVAYISKPLKMSRRHFVSRPVKLRYYNTQIVGRYCEVQQGELPSSSFHGLFN